MKRHHFLDTMRGGAVVMMIIFHLIYDLHYFGFIEMPLSNTAIIYWRSLIASLFLIAVGVSLSFSYAYNFRWHKYFKRLLKLALAASLISAGTYLAFPNAWVYFGILHLILVSSIFGIVFVNRPNTALIIGSIILLLDATHMLNVPSISDIVDFLPRATLDFYPLIPWVAMVLIGIFLAHQDYFRNITIRVAWLAFLGKHTLVIYMTHQIVLFGLLASVYYIISLT